MPVVGWLPHAIRDERGRWLADSDRHHVVFENGRHRTAYLRDHGATAMPVLAYYTVADIIAAELGTSKRCSVINAGAQAFTKSSFFQLVLKSSSAFNLNGVIQRTPKLLHTSGIIRFARFALGLECSLERFPHDVGHFLYPACLK
jgi:hypothetical protein